MNEKYEAVIGLEVHMQLLTESKAYCSDPNEYGALPNTLVSPLTLGHPGTLPRANKKVVEFAVRLGLAIGATIRRENHYARKNYFYADLPKGYQITQDTTPICTGGKIMITDPVTGQPKAIGITRIHMEEDAGKSLHDQDRHDTLVDLNRAGVPLLELVSEPDFRHPEEAYQYLTEVRKLVRYLEICDGNMEEGSLRCDANISVMPKGSKTFGQRTEVKNMNSIRNVQRAIEHEIKRQIGIVEAGGKVAMETRSFDAVKGVTFALRSKELANDYRYFPEPDLQPVIVGKEFIEHERKNLPPLPNELVEKYRKLGLSDYDAGVLTGSKDIALYFEELLKHSKNPKLAANWLMGPVKSWINEQASSIDKFPLSPEKISSLIRIIEEGKVSHTAAMQKIYPALLREPGADPVKIAEKENLLVQSDEGPLKSLAEQALAKFPAKVTEYRNGKTGLLGLFMGEVMKLSGGKADPKTVDRILKELLSN